MSHQMLLTNEKLIEKLSSIIFDEIDSVYL